MSLLDKAEDRLEQSLCSLATTIVTKPDCWVGGHPEGDVHGEYCPSCCKKVVDNLNNGIDVDGETTLSVSQKAELAKAPAFRDGGWGSEYDRITRCNECHAYLMGSLTEEGVKSELDTIE
jgi:hypothetical protein